MQSREDTAHEQGSPKTISRRNRAPCQCLRAHPARWTAVHSHLGGWVHVLRDNQVTVMGVGHQRFYRLTTVQYNRISIDPHYVSTATTAAAAAAVLVPASFFFFPSPLFFFFVQEAVYKLYFIPSRMAVAAWPEMGIMRINVKRPSAQRGGCTHHSIQCRAVVVIPGMMITARQHRWTRAGNREMCMVAWAISNTLYTRNL